MNKALSMPRAIAITLNAGTNENDKTPTTKNTAKAVLNCQANDRLNMFFSVNKITINKPKKIGIEINHCVKRCSSSEVEST